MLRKLFSWPWLRVWITAGLTAAAVEMLFVLPIQKHFGVTPAQLFQSIAMGALGPAAFQAGLYSVLLGVAVHILISLASALLFAAAMLRIAVVRRHYLIAGILYGVVVFAVMSLVVLPLSAIGFAPPKTIGLFLTSLSVHLFAFGLPIGLVCGRGLPRIPVPPEVARP